MEVEFIKEEPRSHAAHVGGGCGSVWVRGRIAKYHRPKPNRGD